MSEDKLKLLWIEWGRPLPKYLKNNVFLHRRLFPEIPQVLISDQKNVSSKLKSNASNYRISEIPKSPLTLKFDELTAKIDIPYGQRNFWVGTIRRFFLIYDFMSWQNLSKVLHLESDNVLLDANLLEKTLASINGGLAYPRQSKSEGCASIFYVSDINMLREFLEFICIEWSKGFITDMQLLGKFMKVNTGASELNSLPRGPFIFDPGSYGKYFIGSDARNFRIPLRRRAVVTEDKTSLLEQMKRIQIVADRSGRLVKVYVNDNSKLLNVHIHSKQIPKKPHQFETLVRKSMGRRKTWLWHQGTIDWLVVTERFLSKLSRLVGRRGDIRLR